MNRSPYEKVKSRTRLLEKIETIMPGFRGYKLKELRREADKLLRDYLYQQLNLVKRDLNEVFQKIVDNQLKEVWTDMERLVIRLDTIAIQINRSSYGYSGFFDAVKVNESELDAMLEFDLKLVEMTRELGDEAKLLKNEVFKDQYENIRSYITELNLSITAFDAQYHERKNIILGVM